MVFFYKALSNLFFPIFILIIYLRKVLKKEDALRYKEKIFYKHFRAIKKKDTKLIWFHAASVGELKSIIPILHQLNKRKPSLQFLITTVTITSAKLIKEEKLDNLFHRFFPVDSEFLIKKFIKSWKPDAIFLVDSEIWPNLILSAKKNNIPLSLINARITKKTFKKWKLVPSFAREIFSIFDLCLASNRETVFHLEKLNAKNIHFLGNIKLINEIAKNLFDDPNQDYLSKNKFWIAMSTHHNEEELCLNVHIKLKEHYKKVKTVIAPRHIQRIKEIRKICNNLDLSYQVLNKNDVILNDKEIILINSYGSLPVFLKYSKSVFVGKSTIKKLENVGGQNPIEAVNQGCKIYHGPFVYNFEEIYKILLENKISEEIKGIDDLASNLIFDLKDLANENKQFSSKINKLGQKTLNDTMKKINKFLFNEVS